MFRNYSTDRCYIIAEIGGNFTTLEQAKRLIDAASSCGVDAVKLQTYRADTLASRKAIFDMENTGVVPQYDLFKKYEVDEALHRKVFAYAESKGLDWFSTPSHETDVDLLSGLGVGVYKIGSDDAVNIPFLRYAARTSYPTLYNAADPVRFWLIVPCYADVSHLEISAVQHNKVSGRPGGCSACSGFPKIDDGFLGSCPGCPQAQRLPRLNRDDGVGEVHRIPLEFVDAIRQQPAGIRCVGNELLVDIS